MINLFGNLACEYVISGVLLGGTVVTLIHDVRKKRETDKLMDHCETLIKILKQREMHHRLELVDEGERWACAFYERLCLLNRLESEIGTDEAEKVLTGSDFEKGKDEVRRFWQMKRNIILESEGS